MRLLILCASFIFCFPILAKTIEGQILSIQKYSQANQPTAQVYLIVQTDQGEYTVELGPERYLYSQGFALSPRDRVEIQGNVRQIGNLCILKATQYKGEFTLHLPE